ncbi:MAG: hypothetical protein NT074_02100 [Methanomicrobiales archaeon]|nr:hypothetical protein [Methanomicrobiales archaeon]
MPQKDEIWLLHEVRRLWGRVPFNLFTGRDRKEVLARDLDEGVDLYIDLGGGGVACCFEMTHLIHRGVRA